MGDRQDEFNHIHDKRSFFSELEPLKNSVPNGTTHNHSFSPNIRVPVEIAHSTFDFTIYRKIKMSPKIQEISDINWTSSPVASQINLLTDKLWVSGKLCAEICYTKKNDTNIHIQSIFFPWRKTVFMEYCYPPVIPLSNEKRQYELNPGHPVSHYEQIIYQNDQPTFEIARTKIVATKSIITNHKFYYLELHIDCEMDYQIFQNQVVKSNR